MKEFNESLVGSDSCNPTALVGLRKSRGWTQTQLATVAGYSTRLVVKAEAGKPINRATIHDLAEALSTSQRVVTYEDLVFQPIRLAKELIYGTYEYGTELFEKISYFIDPEICLVFAGDPQQIPFAGSHKGLSAVKQALTLFATIMEAPVDCDYRATHHFVVNQANPNEVIVWGQSFFHAIGHPQSPMDIQLRLQFRHGKLFQIDDRFDTQFAAKQFDRSSQGTVRAP